MSVMSAEYHKGDVTKPGEQKPQGEAKALNDAMQPMPDEGGVPEPPMDDPGPPIRLQRPQPLPPPSGEDAMLYGMTTRPNEPVSTPRNRAEIPPYIYEQLPAIVRAAQAPDATPALKALVRLLDYHVNQASRR